MEHESRVLPLEQGHRIGNYQIRRLIGRGTVAEVYRAFSPHLNTEVALKVLHLDPGDTPEQIAAVQRRFSRELQHLITLQHPHIARVIDFGITNGTYYIVTQLVEGPSLRDMLSERRSGFRHDHALDIFRQVADAVGFAHRRGVLHQGIRPGNILMSDGVRPQLVDFGIARILAEDDMTTARFSPRAPIYMAPEQATGGAITTRTDVYALGVLLYEMITGDVPFKGGTPARILVQHLQEPVRPPSEIDVEIDPRVEDVIMRALEKNLLDRFDSPNEMVDALTVEISDTEYDTINLTPINAKELRQQIRVAHREYLETQAVEEPEAEPESLPERRPVPFWEHEYIWLWAGLLVAALTVTLLTVVVVLMLVL